MNTLDEIQKLIDAQLEIKKDTNKKLQTLMKDIFNNFFISNPEINGIKWAQFTPYFNDGEPCIFSLGEFEYSFNDSEDENTWISSYELSSERYALVTDFEKLISKIPDEIFEEAFGDHAEIIAEKDKFNITEYYHD